MRRTKKPDPSNESARRDQADTKILSNETRALLKDTTDRLNAVLERLRALAASPPQPLRLVRK